MSSVIGYYKLYLLLTMICLFCLNKNYRGTRERSCRLVHSVVVIKCMCYTW